MSKISFTKQQKFFVFFAILCAFLISCEYGVTRPASQSIFIAKYGAKSFPFAWAALVPLNLIIVSLYNRFLAMWGCKKVFFFSILSVIGINLSSAFWIYDNEYLSFIQFLCKDVYILLIFKQLWSLIHISIPDLAKFFYGIIFSAGGVGAVVGGMIAKKTAVEIGSSYLFFLTLPIYILLLFGYLQLLYLSPLKSQDHFKMTLSEQGNTKEGFSLIKHSRFLVFILLLVIFMQLSIALIEYQFNIFLSNTITNVDLRTEYYGKILSIINFFSTIFQISGGFILTQLLGLKKSQLMIPLVLCSNAMLFMFFPIFSIASLSFITIKTIDFSLFSIGREMLYIPLSLNEKFRAKAVIDVFVYRSSKAFASLFLITLEFFSPQNLVSIIGGISVSIFFLWVFVVLFMFQYYEKKTPAS